jgi:parallel beta-helix repeat protein
MAVNNAQNGDVIYVKKGVYLESVTVNKPLTLQGAEEYTIVDGNNNGPAFLVETNNVNITGFKIRNVEYPPPNTDSLRRLAGIHLSGAYDCSIFDNVVTGCGKGIWIYEGAGNQVLNNGFEGNNYGIVLETTSHNVISNNNAHDGWNGIFLSNAKDNRLKDNRMYNNTCNFGVTGESASAYQNEIDTSNLVDDKKLYFMNGLSSQTISSQTHPDLGALVLANSKDITVQNLCITNSYSGIQLFNSENTKIVNNTLQVNKYGMYIGNCSDCTLSTNSLKESSETGIYVKGSKAISINKNALEQTGSKTINMEGSNDCDVEENTFCGYHEYGICMDTSNNNRFADNTQSGTDKVMYVFWLKASCGNLVDSNRFPFCALAVKISEGSDNNNILNNSFGTDRGSTGLTLNTANHNTISDNVFDNFSTAFELANAEKNLIARNTITCRDNYAIKLFQFSHNVFEGNRFIGSADVWDMGPGVGKAASVNTWK